MQCNSNWNWKYIRDSTYRTHVNEHRGAHLIFYVSEGALIRGGRSFKPGCSLKKCEVHTSYHIIFQNKQNTKHKIKRKYDLLNLEVIIECIYKFHYYKKQRYLTKENSCFVILTNYMNERLCRHCKFPNGCPFPGLTGALI